MTFNIFSDLHLHNYARFNKYQKTDTRNSRLDNCLNVIVDLFRDANKKRHKEILFAGDLYDQQHALPTIVIEKTIEIFDTLFKMYPDINFICISGNHDHANKNKIKSPATTALTHLSNLFPNFNLIDNKIYQTSGNVKICGIPYYEHKEDFSTALDSMIGRVTKEEGERIILLTHQTPPYTGAKHDADILPTDKRFAFFDFIFNGHIHAYERLAKNFVNVGSPLHRDLGDEGQDKGYLTYDSESNSIIRTLLDYPKFKRILSSEVTKEDLNNSYIVPIYESSEVVEVSQGKTFDLTNSYSELITEFCETQNLSKDHLEIGLKAIENLVGISSKSSSKLTFIDLYIEGFGSILFPTDFKLDREGIHLLKGKVGSGKTTIINALMYVLFGENLKGISNTKLPFNREHADFKGLKVGLKLKVNDDSKVYEIFRHINYKGKTKELKGKSSLMLFVDGEQTNGQHKEDVQKEIDDIIGITSRVFLNGVLFGQRMKRFAEEKPAEKRRIFDEILDFNWVDIARENNIEVLNKIKEDDIRIGIINDLFNEKIISTKNQVEQIKESNNILEETKTKTLEDLKDKISTLKETELEVIPELLVFPEELLNLKLEEQKGLKHKSYVQSLELAKIAIPLDLGEEEIEKDLYKELEEIKRNIFSKQSEITHLIPPFKPELKCITCSHPLSLEKRNELTNIYENEKKEFTKKKERGELLIISYEELQRLKKIHIQELATIRKESFRDLVKQVEYKRDKQDRILLELKDKEIEINNEIDKLNKEKSVILQENQKRLVLEAINTEREHNNNNMLKLRAQYELNLKNILEEPIKNGDYKVLEDEIKRLENKIIENKSKIIINSKIKELHLFWHTIGFMNKGIKGYLINSAMSLLNKSIIKYSSSLGMKINYSIDTTKTSKPFITSIYRDGVEQDYEEYSGGEKAEIDVATAFALHDVVSCQLNCNILIMDEIFEGLDEEGIDLVFELIRNKGEGKSIFVITHSAHIDSLNTKSIEIIKKDYITYIN